jgi:hypothetical protein
MMNLLCRPAGVVLVCSGCESEWPVYEAQPFVAQLRLVALGHDCPSRAAEQLMAARSARPSHLRLVVNE